MMKFKGEFFFDPEDKIYKDHFPGNPIVPGSLIIYAFLKKVGEIKNHPFHEISIENFRFRIFIRPGIYDYEITETDKILKCILFSENKKAATGIIKL